MKHHGLYTARSTADLRRGRNDWYRISTVDSTTALLTNKAGQSMAKVYIYDEIGYFGVTAADFVKDLNDLDVSEIDLRLNTPGGNVFDGMAIYNALRDHSATVTATVDGLAASAGSYIFQAGNRRIMNRSTELMIHPAQGITAGSAKVHREQADLLDKLTRDVANIYVDRAGMKLDDALAAMDAETWYDAEEAVAAGLADEVSGIDGDVDNTFDLSIYAHAGRADAPAPTIPARSDFDYAAAANALRGAFS